MTSRERTPLRIAVTEPPPDPATPFRDRIAARSAEFDATYPRALDLEARVLAGLHGALHGVATLLRGLHGPRRFRESLMGDRHFHLADLCRLATEPSREAKEAARAAVGELAQAMGYRLEPLDPAAVEAHEALAVVAETSGAFLAEFNRDLRDGVMTPEEADEIRPELHAAKSALARAEACVVEAQQRGRR